MEGVKGLTSRSTRSRENARSGLTAALGVRTMSTLRWLLLVPTAIAAWYSVFVLGMFTYSYVDTHLCPPEDMISGLCTNSTVEFWRRIVAHAFVALSALAVMTSTVVVSPGKKNPIALLTLVVGTVVAAYLGARTHEWTLFAAATGGGIAGLAIIVHLLPHAAPNNALQPTCEDARG